MAAGCLLVWLSPPRAALAFYFWIVLLYPQEWVVKFGGLPALLPAKVIVIPLVLNLALKQDRLKGFKPNLLDLTVVLLILGKFLATLAHDSFRETAANISHDFTAHTLVYFCIRLGVTSRDEVHSLVRTLTYIAVLLVGVAVYEAFSGNFLYDQVHRLLTGRPWDLLGLTIREVRPRLGLYRAMGSFSVSLSLGLFFAGMFALQFILWTEPAWPRWRRVAVPVALVVGMVMTVSSTALFCFGVSALTLAYYPFRKTMPLAVPAAVCLLVFLQFLGPQLGLCAPLSSYVRELAFQPDNADYRFGLFEEAFGGGMRDHWYFGYGYNVGIGVENPNPEFQWERPDIVNIHIAHLVRFGAVAAVPFLLTVLLAFLKLAQAGIRKQEPRDGWMIWCFLALFLGWQVSFLAVASINQIANLLYAFLGVIATLPEIAAGKEPAVEGSGASGPARKPVRFRVREAQNG